MSIREKLAAAASTTPTVKRGFVLDEPNTLRFKNIDQFYVALKDQEDSWAPVPADGVGRIDIDGRIVGGDLKLSRAAFSDLCQFTGIPHKFINQLACIDPQQALDVVETMVGSVFQAGSNKTLMVDTRYNRVEGIVGAETYSPLSNRQAVDYLLSAVPGLSLASGWLCGPSMRAAALTKERPLEVQKGDIVHVGVSIENAIHGDRSAKIRDYVERLVCTNGMTAMKDGNFEAIIHRGDVDFLVAQAIVRAATTAEDIVLRAGIAVDKFMFANDIRAMRTFLRDSPGGSQAIETAAVKGAQEEAEKEGRSPEELTVWNWVNAVTEQAHGAPSLKRRMDIEGLGHSVLFRFTEPATV